MKFGKANDGHIEIEISSDLLISNFTYLVEVIIHSIYPSLNNKVCIKETIRDSTNLLPKLSFVDEINSYMLSQVDEVKEHFSLDSICKTSMNRSYQVDLLTPKVLSSLHCCGLPNHKISLKVGVPIILI